MIPNKIRTHFVTRDSKISAIIETTRSFAITKSSDPFSDLVESVINQQLSEKAGATIFGRFTKIFPKGKLTAKKILQIPDKRLREVGMSWSKVSYVKNIARSSLDFGALARMSDEEAIAELTKIKGVGRWTAEMFLMFSLGRQDIFSFGDLGLRRAIQKVYKLKKEPTVRQLEKISSRWKPYRTWAARILWRSLDEA